MAVFGKDDYGKVSDVLRNVHPIAVIRLFILCDIAKQSNWKQIHTSLKY